LFIVFQLQANLVINEDAGVMLKPHNKLKHMLETKALSSKPGPKPIKKQLETTVENGDLISQGKEPIIEDEEETMEIDKNLLPMKLWSKKKGVLEKFTMEKASTIVFGRTSPHDELL
jgi:hypothetical protein